MLFFLRKQDSRVFIKFTPSGFWSQSVPTLSLLEYEVSSGLSYMAFILLRCITSMANLLRFFFYLERMLNSVRCFSCI